MAYSELTITTDWPNSAQYTAIGATACMLAAPYNSDLFFAINATQPSISPAKFHLIRGGDSKAFVLANGEALWVASPTADESFTAVLTTGPAS